MRNRWDAIFRTCVVFFIGACIGSAGASEPESSPYQNMSLDELLAMPLAVGTLTKDAVKRAPVSVTIISAADIAVTPARTVLDLMEVYVPGFTYVQHFNGPRLGMRGILGDQNHSFLMLVNGRNVSLKTNDGFSREILMRDLNDIERIEIIRGPGSVTYGPGGTAGIINIITRTAATSPGARAGAEINAGYRYGGIYGSYGYRSPGLDLYLYGSYGASEGEQDTEFFYIDRAHGYGYGFMGNDWGKKGKGTPAPNLYEDFLDKPQVKLQLDARVGDNLVAWARYTTFSQVKLLQDAIYADGTFPRGEYGETFTAWLEHEMTLTPSIYLETSIGFDGASLRDMMGASPTRVHDDPLNVTESYSENEVRARSLLHGDAGDLFSYAVGGEIAYEFWRPEWGEEDDTFLMRFRNPIGRTVSSTSSPFWQDGMNGYSLVSTDDLDAFSFSVLGEGALDITDSSTLTLSGRADKHEFSEWVYSPRIALLTDLTSHDTIKLIAQRSVRLPAYTDLYSQHEISGSLAEPEILEGIEAIYARRLSDSLNFNLAAYYNTIDQIGWAPGTGQNEVLGNLDLWGAETELSYSTKDFIAGLNYSYIRQLDWDPEVEDQANLVNLDGDPMYVEDFAENRFNNLPSNMLKAYTTIHLPWNLVWHTNARFMWDYGQNDMLDMFSSAHEQYGTAASQAEMQAIRDTLEYYGYGEPSFTLNTQVQWTLPIKTVEAKLGIYAMNLLESNHIRYVSQYWEADRQYPRQAGFVEEPLSLGMQLNVRF